MSNTNGGFANPLPSALIVLGLACFLFFAVLTGQVTGAATGIMGIWLLAGFLVQVIAGIIELKEGNTTAGNIFLFFSAFFLLASGASFLFKYFAAIHNWPYDVRIEGWAWVALSLTLWLWTPTYFKSPLYMLTVVILFDVAIPMLALIDLGLVAKAVYAPIVGWLALVAGVSAIMMASSVVLNTHFGRQVIPMPTLNKQQPHA